MKKTDLRAPQNKQYEFSLPRGSVSSGHLIFMGDIASLTILNNPVQSELIRGRFSHYLPGTQSQEGKVNIQYHDSCTHQAVSSHHSQGEIKLNPMIPWEVEFHGNISNLDTDLRELDLRSLDLLGSVSRLRLLLSKPANTSFIYMAGGIHSGSILVPLSVGIRVRMSRSTTNLVFGNGQFREIGGKTSLENSDFKYATSRYDICIAGEASNITIEQ